MSFTVGSIYLLVDSQNQWRLFVAGSPTETSNAYRTSVGTLYYPGPDLRSRQKLNVQPLPPVPHSSSSSSSSSSHQHQHQAPTIVLIIHLVNLLSSLHFKSVSSLDNHVDKVVSGGDTEGLPPKNEGYWWFDILYRLHNAGIVNVDAPSLAQRIRAETASAFGSWQRSGRCSFVNL